MDKLTQDLNKEQKEAVEYTKGPLLVLAGAGSGKTKVLTHRVAWFISQGIALPENVLLFTFTNKAAGEMKERVMRLINRSPAFAGTFHAFCVRVLRQSGQALDVFPNFLIYDDDDSVEVIKEILADLELVTDKYNPKALLSQISEAKNQMLTPALYAEFIQSDWQEKGFKIWTEYEKHLQEAGALDFDDLLLKTVRLFDQRSEILTNWQNVLTHVFVDEWQDTNKVQYKLTKQIVGGRENLTAVGDAAQCLPPGTFIETENGSKKIETIKEGDVVISATGRGTAERFKVKHVYKRKHKGKLIVLKTKTGKILKITPNHVLFAKLTPKEDLYHVYLMYRKDKGFRIGQAKGLRS